MRGLFAGFSTTWRAVPCGRMPTAMSFFVRLFVAWLIVAALPLQGIASASMLLCGQPPAAEAAVHEDAAAHADHHGHAHASHALPDEADAQPALAAAADESQASASHDHHGHSCSICASCCHVLAMTETVAPLVPSELPSAALAQPSAPVTTRASPLPDKPPRA